MSEDSQKFTFAVAVCFTLNYIIGTGFLTLPWAFHQTGYLLGSIIVFVVTVFSVMAVVFILEAMSRANNILKGGRGLLHHAQSGVRHYQSVEMTGVENGDKLPGSNEDSYKFGGLLGVGSTKYELTELCQLFLGSTGKMCYTTIIAVYMYGSLWAYSSVFAKAFSAHMSIGENSYAWYLVLFGLVVVPASLMELSEQITVQVTLSICRILMVLVMVITVVFAEHESYASFDNFQPEPNAPLNLWNMNKIYLLLPVAAYANIFHHSIPSLSQPVIDKSKLAGIFSSALWISMAAYISIGITIASYFGDHTKVSSNINWESYHGHILSATSGSPWYAQWASFFVVLFPAFDVASAFPLNAITLGNSLMSSYYGPEMHIMEKSRFHISMFRLLASVPPIFAAYLVSNLGVITDYAGLTGFAVAFIFPALLAYASEKKLSELGYPSDTLYSSRYLSRFAQLLTFGLGLALFVYVLSSLITIGPPPSDRRY